MSKAFNYEERNEIRNKLIEVGLKKFSELGLKKVTVEEITKEVGISKGAFYTFFNSKEELFFETHLVEEQELKNLIDSYMTRGEFTKKSFRELMYAMFDCTDKSKIVKRIFDDGILPILIRKLPKQLIVQHFEEDNKILLRPLRELIKRGLIEYKSVEDLNMAISTVFYISFQKSFFSEEKYLIIRNSIIDIFIDGLFFKENTND